MSNIVLIDIMDKNKHDAGTKGRNDVTAILNSLGYKTVVMFNRTHNNISRTAEMLKALNSMGSLVSEGSVILLQYPYQKTIMDLFLDKVEKLRKKKKCKLVILIHDIQHLRHESFKDESMEEMQKLEVGFFNRADAVIVHNSKMKQTLFDEGVVTPMYELGLFDYLYNGKPARNTLGNEKVLTFAGNLSVEKSGFIYNYRPKEGIKLNLYGSKPGELSSFCDYKGSFPPDVLIENMEGNYGLVWDGADADTCSGYFGNYLRYNNPHKLSLYIAAGLPVIVWSQSALAGFVTSCGVGCCIDSLRDIEGIPAPDSEPYQNMQKNVDELGEKLRTGQMLKSVIEEIEREFAS